MKRVYVLGAGASKDYGFPLGSELKDLVLRKLDGLFTTPSCLELFNDIGYDANFIRNFTDGFRWNSEYETIDSYLKSMECVERKEFASYIIGWSISDYQVKQRILSREGWYETFFSIFKGPDFEIANTAVITFNYDQSFEYFLETKISTIAPAINQGEFKKKFDQLEVLHPHGRLSEGRPADRPINMQNILELGQQIKTVSDDFSNNNVYEKSQNIVKDSDEVVFMGFGYHQDIFDTFFGDVDFKPKNVIGTSVGISDEDAYRFSDRFGQNISHVIPTGWSVNCEELMSAIEVSGFSASIEQIRRTLSQTKHNTGLGKGEKALFY